MEDSPHRSTGPHKLRLGQYTPVWAALLVALFFFPTLQQLFQRWIIWDEGLAHGLPMMAVFLYALYASSPWQRYPQATWLNLLTLAGLLLTSLFWFFVAWIRLELLEQLALLAALLFTYAWLYSWRTLYQQRLIFGLPLFAIPIWDFLNSSLVSLSSLVVGQAVQFIGMPAIIDGNSIFIPYGHLLIADGCSGIRYLIISLALGYIAAYFNHYRTTQLLLALALAALLGLLANWIRIFLLVTIGYQSQMQSPLMQNHEIFGWLVFSLLIFPVLYFAPQSTAKKNEGNKHSATGIHAPILAFMVLAIGPLLYYIPHQTPAVTALVSPFNDKVKAIAIADMPLRVIAPRPSHQQQGKIHHTYLQVHQYQRRTKNEKLVPYLPRLYNHEEWSNLQAEPIELLNGSADIREFRHKHHHQRLLQLQWFSLMGYNTHSKNWAKVLQIPATIRGDNLFSIYTLQILCVTDLCDDERKQLLDIANHLPSYTHP